MTVNASCAIKIGTINLNNLETSDRYFCTATPNIFGVVILCILRIDVAENERSDYECCDIRVREGIPDPARSIIILYG